MTLHDLKMRTHFLANFEYALPVDNADSLVPQCFVYHRQNFSRYTYTLYADRPPLHPTSFELPLPVPHVPHYVDIQIKNITKIKN